MAEHALLVTVEELPNYGAVDFLSQWEGTDVVFRNGQAATNLMLGWMRPTVVPPLISWTEEIKMHTASVWIYLLKSVAGMAPIDAAMGDQNIRQRYLDAEAWARNVGMGKEAPAGVVDSGDKPGGGGAELIDAASDTRRGW
jgi:hypothetical protein